MRMKVPGWWRIRAALFAVVVSIATMSLVVLRIFPTTATMIASIAALILGMWLLPGNVFTDVASM